MFDKVLIANRGVIVPRIIRTLKKLGVKSVVIYSTVDENNYYLREADETFPLGDGPTSQTYLNADKILSIAKETGAQAIHPGYGFLSENADFIERCGQAGIVWLGPTADQVRSFGLKHKARELAAAANVPLVPGTGLLTTVEEACDHAKRLQFPIILKSTAGGGGIGMHICRDEAELRSAYETVKNLSKKNFGDDSVYLEVYIENARHIEVQLFGDGNGEVVSLGERDCSSQRRNQKVIEECPAPAISEATRNDLHKVAVQLGKLVNYRSAGTVEYIYDSDRKEFYFLEVNTRLQVEHGVTEMVYGVDLVEWMVRLGSGDLHSLKELRNDLSPKGHAIQARVYAEDPLHNYRPSAGLLSYVNVPTTTGNHCADRIDTWVESGTEVSALYDPMLAKVIKWAPSREEAINGLIALMTKNIEIYGIVTNLNWLASILAEKRFQDAAVSTRWLSEFEWYPKAFEITAPGTMTMIQDFPGRSGYWDVGVPPSGPFDDWSFRLGNEALLGNDKRAAGLEITVSGPTLKFYCSCNVTVTGAPLTFVKRNGENVQQWAVLNIERGDVLALGKVSSGGMRAYVLFEGGIQCPDYLGSKSTFTLGQFGGHVGRALRTGDRIGLNPPSESVIERRSINHTALVPGLGNKHNVWNIAVIYGPHGSPDFFTQNDIDMVFNNEWEVHYNSSRTGVRLIGPRPEWARKDGGEAGLHPSNIHDNAYAFGSIDFTGDMPIILGPDGPSLGGFVCPATVIRCERWKMGQLAPGDKVKFVPVSFKTADYLEKWYKDALDDPSFVKSNETPDLRGIEDQRGSPVIRTHDSDVKIVYRRAGNDFVLVEFGPMELDISLRFRAHAWMLWLQQQNVEGVLELTPGIRSLQVHYNPSIISIESLLDILKTAEVELEDVKDLEIQVREVHLPLSWDDEACRTASEYYQRSVRNNAPWCPDNIEFIRRINGLDSADDVFNIVFDATYLVMGLGDVYLGAPVATPLDPSQRLVTTKYNPARTWTAENSVGIGGAYLCVYGMEGPGGYQFVGRTLQMWNRYRQTELFEKPWLLRFFDQIKFHRVSHEELMQIRREFPQGRYTPRIIPKKFKLADYFESLKPDAEKIKKFRECREKAFREEIDMWHREGLFTFQDADTEQHQEEATLKDGESGIDSPIAGSVWKILVKEGDMVEPEQVVAVIESMKMEFSVNAPTRGKVTRVTVQEGVTISSGQTIVIMES